jgi:hypothetical protein
LQDDMNGDPHNPSYCAGMYWQVWFFKITVNLVFWRLRNTFLASNRLRTLKFSTFDSNDILHFNTAFLICIKEKQFCGVKLKW